MGVSANRGGPRTRSHECERCTHECVRHELISEKRDGRASQESRLKAGCSQDWLPHNLPHKAGGSGKLLDGDVQGLRSADAAYTEGH